MKRRHAFEPGIRELRPGFLSTLAVRVLKGRDLSETDEASTREAVISESVARTLFGDRDPIGSTIHTSGDAANRSFSVVGLVADIRLAVHEAPRPQVYTLLRHGEKVTLATHIAIRATRPEFVAAAVPDVVRATDARIEHFIISVQSRLVAEQVAALERSLRWREALWAVGATAGLGVSVLTMIRSVTPAISTTRAAALVIPMLAVGVVVGSLAGAYARWLMLGVAGWIILGAVGGLAEAAVGLLPKGTRMARASETVSEFSGGALVIGATSVLLFRVTEPLVIAAMMFLGGIVAATLISRPSVDRPAHT